MIYAILSVLFLVGVGWVGGAFRNLNLLFGVILPYVALATFIFGYCYRIIGWARSPVPFCIPTTCGQQRSLSWIRQDKLESPTTTPWVIARMALEVLLFRSLWRNERVEIKGGGKLIFSPKRYLWLGGLLFHWSLAMVLFRHLRFFTEPIFPGLTAIQGLDSFFEIGVPSLYMSDIFILVAITYLFLRRVYSPQLRLISLPTDYFALFLLGAIFLSGVLMRHFFKADVERVKELIMGLVSFRPVVPAHLGAFFYAHLFLVSILVAYFPFSKLMHAAGVFLSPTRNLKNDSRMRRHVNPWGYAVKVHTYQEYEDEFRDAMIEAGIPVENEGKAEVKEMRS
ncbi:MAG: sulfate reduction electron transfer complex DsrMKJOP subunit DsrM [Syntrophorhabdales bacterium]|jgi:nitrate reductase gamma subunit